MNVEKKTQQDQMGPLLIVQKLDSIPPARRRPDCLSHFQWAQLLSTSYLHTHEHGTRVRDWVDSDPRL